MKFRKTLRWFTEKENEIEYPIVRNVKYNP